VNSAADPALLQALRDIHPPEAVAWWPPAPGWWGLSALLLLLLLLGFVVWRRRGRLRREALAELDGIRRRVSRGEGQRSILAVSMLLRRVALARFGREAVAGLTDMDWPDFLNRHGGRFGESEALALAEGGYRPTGDDDLEALLTAGADWIRKNA